MDVSITSDQNPALNLANCNQRINNSYDADTWKRMVAIKQRILRIWDMAIPPVRICCIKFAQRVVLAQSVASGAEPRVSRSWTLVARAEVGSELT
jgi:hypothetical protein